MSYKQVFSGYSVGYISLNTNLQCIVGFSEYTEYSFVRHYAIDCIT